MITKSYLYLCLSLMIYSSTFSMAPELEKFLLSNESLHEIIEDAIDEEKLIVTPKNPNTLTFTTKTFQEDDSKLVKYILDNRVPLAQRPEDLLDLAIMHGSIRILRHLIEENLFQDISSTYIQNWTFRTIQANDLIKRSLEAEKLIVTPNNRRPLKGHQDTFTITSKAFDDDDAELLNFIIEHKIPLSQTYNKLIRMAVKKGSEEILNLFNNKQLFKNLSRQENKQLLINAIKSDNTNTVTFYLYTVKFNVNKSDSIFLLRTKSSDMFDFLISSGFKLDLNKLDQLISIAIKYGNIHVLNYLKARNLFENYTKNNILTFIDLAINAKKPGCVSFFLENFDLEQMGHDEQNFMDLPENENLKQNVPILEKSFSSRSIRSLSSKMPRSVFGISKSPPREAYYSERPELKENKATALNRLMTEQPTAISSIAKLIKAGGNPNARYENGITTLMRTAQKGIIKAVEYLLDLGANPYLVDNYGRSALMLAAEHGHPGVIEILLSSEKNLAHGEHKNIQVKLRDNKGNNALMYACRNPWPKCIEKLLKYGSSFVENINHETPLLILAKISEKDIFEKIKQKCKNYVNNLQAADIMEIYKIKHRSLSKKKRSIEEPSEEPIEEPKEIDSNKLNIFESYIKLHEALSSITDQVNPLHELLEYLQNEIENSEDSMAEKTNNKILQLCMELIENEKSNIIEACSLILESKSDIKRLNADKQNALKYAIVNDNKSVVKAIAPHISQKDLGYAIEVARLNHNIEIVSYLNEVLENTK